MRIGILGGSFDPAGAHHLKIVRQVLKLDFFQKIVIFPCGPRPDKKNIESSLSVYRAAILAITFRGLSKHIEIELSDLEKNVFTRTIDIEKKYKQKGDVWHIVGFDLIQGGSTGSSVIQKKWTDGMRLWEESQFIVVKRNGFTFKEKDLPPQSKVIQAEVHGSSTEIRNSRLNAKSIKSFVVPEVAEYIERYGLYKGRLPLQQTLYTLKTPRLLVVADENNPKAVAIKRKLQKYNCKKNPNLIVDIGGDGNKLRSIRKYWQMRLPFFGINAGHRGYLLNEIDDIFKLFPLKHGLVVHHLPLLKVEIQFVDGTLKRTLGFNEAWVERETGQSAWLEVIWNKENVIQKIVGDGLIVSTAAGSTGYAQNICGFSLPTHVRELLLVGMAISEPTGWRNSIFPQNSTFQIRSLDIHKRPIRAFVDGIPQNSVEKIKISASKIASVELAFLQGFDIASKHTKIQLPYFKKI